MHYHSFLEKIQFRTNSLCYYVTQSCCIYNIQYWPKVCGFSSSFTGCKDVEILGTHSLFEHVHERSSNNKDVKLDLWQHQDCEKAVAETHIFEWVQLHPLNYYYYFVGSIVRTSEKRLDPIAILKVVLKDKTHLSIGRFSYIFYQFSAKFMLGC